jgi:hypothetical protein
MFEGVLKDRATLSGLPDGKVKVALPIDFGMHSPIFHGIKKHLLKLDMSFLVNFDTLGDPQSRRIAATFTPLAYKHLTQLQERGYSVTLITRLF